MLNIAVLAVALVQASTPFNRAGGRNPDAWQDHGTDIAASRHRSIPSFEQLPYVPPAEYEQEQDRLRSLIDTRNAMTPLQRVVHDAPDNLRAFMTLRTFSPKLSGVNVATAAILFLFSHDYQNVLSVALTQLSLWPPWAAYILGVINVLFYNVCTEGLRFRIGLEVTDYQYLNYCYLFFSVYFWFLINVQFIYCSHEGCIRHAHDLTRGNLTMILHVGLLIVVSSCIPMPLIAYLLQSF